MKVRQLSTIVLLAVLVSAIMPMPAFAADITVTTNAATYTRDSIVTITGTADAGALVSIEVKNPSSTSVWLDTVTATAGDYSSAFRLLPDAALGTYTVYVSTAGSTDETTFTVEEIITVSTDKASYLADEIVTISGTAGVDALVGVDVKNPSSTSIWVDTVTSTAGVYSSAFRLQVDAMLGTYMVYVSTAGSTDETTFTVEERGTLNISTTPVNGEVFVDGVSWGIAPQSRVLTVGTYTVTFGDMDGYDTPESIIASVISDETVEVLEIYVPELPAETTGEETLDSNGVSKTSFTLGETVLASSTVANTGTTSQSMVIAVQWTDSELRALAPSFVLVTLTPGADFTYAPGLVIPSTGFAAGTWTAKINVFDAWPALGGVPIGTPVTITFTVS